MNRFIATWFYIGRIPFAPGTWGSLFAIPFALTMLMTGFSALQFAFAIVILFLIGWFVTAQVTKGKENHDPSEIVIDEVIGQWVALFPIFYTNFGIVQNPFSLLVLVLIGFGLFRLFDIWKPFPVSSFDRRTDAFGVIMDDVAAGIIAALILTAIWIVSAETLNICAPLNSGCS